MLIKSPPGKRQGLKRYLGNYGAFYVMLIPALLFVVLFKFVPYLGSVIAFKNFDFAAGDTLIEAILNSKFVGLDNFRKMFLRADSIQAVINTFVLASLKMVILFPLPIVLAILLNEVRISWMKRTMQTIVYFPNFLSWVVISTMFLQMTQSGGFIYNTLRQLNLPSMPFFNDSRLFRSMLVFTDGWKNTGFGTIVYLAAITGISEELFEAATVDGCDRWQRIWHITLPCIVPVISLVFVLNLGSQLAFGSFEQVFAMYNPSVYATGDIIQTYTYRMGVVKLDYSFSTAVGIFNSVVAMVFIFASNAILKKSTGRSIW